MHAYRILPLLLVAAALASCDAGNMYGPGPGMNYAGTNNAPTMYGIAFHPGTITVSAGAMVTWTNYDSVAHTVTSDSGVAPAFDSGSVGPGATYSLMLTLPPGTYGYHCNIHVGMTGKIVVQ